MSSFLYQAVPEHLATKKIDWNSDDIRLMLLGAGYVPTITHTWLSDVVASEITGTGYAAGGEALTGRFVATTAPYRYFKANVVEWTGATFIARYGVLYSRTPATNATRPLIKLIDFGVSKEPVAGTFRVHWHTDGVFRGGVG